MEMTLQQAPDAEHSGRMLQVAHAVEQEPDRAWLLRRCTEAASADRPSCRAILLALELALGSTASPRALNGTATSEKDDALSERDGAKADRDAAQAEARLAAAQVTALETQIDSLQQTNEAEVARLNDEIEVLKGTITEKDRALSEASSK